MWINFHRFRVFSYSAFKINPRWFFSWKYLKYVINKYLIKQCDKKIHILSLYLSTSSFFREARKDLLLTETIPSKCKIVKILIFCSLSREHLLWKCSRERERNISILTILHLLFYFPVWRFLYYYFQSSY